MRMRLCVCTTVHVFLTTISQQGDRAGPFGVLFWTPAPSGGGISCCACALSTCLCPYAAAWWRKKAMMIHVVVEVVEVVEEAGMH